MAEVSRGLRSSFMTVHAPGLSDVSSSPNNLRAFRFDANNHICKLADSPVAGNVDEQLPNKNKNPAHLPPTELSHNHNLLRGESSGPVSFLQVGSPGK